MINLSSRIEVRHTRSVTPVSPGYGSRIAEFRAEGSPVETVRRRLPKRVGGPKHYLALHFSEVADALARIDATNCAPATKRAIRFTALTASRQVEVRRATGSSSS